MPGLFAYGGRSKNGVKLSLLLRFSRPDDRQGIWVFFYKDVTISGSSMVYNIGKIAVFALRSRHIKRPRVHKKKMVHNYKTPCIFIRGFTGRTAAACARSIIRTRGAKSHQDSQITGQRSPRSLPMGQNPVPPNPRQAHAKLGRKSSIKPNK